MRYTTGTYLDHKKEKVPIHEFVDKELVLYAIASNQRALPNAIDGLKHGHRKIVFSCFKRNLIKGTDCSFISPQDFFISFYHSFSSFASGLLRLSSFVEIRVAQLSGYVSEKAAYHHGEASLCATIVKLAQNFVGSNNINLLVPQGQFGTRLGMPSINFECSELFI
jgi:DNA topoisomerase-2